MMRVYRLDDPYKTYNPFSIDQLQKLLNNVFHIRDYFASFSPRPAVPDPTIVTWPSYFEKMATIIEQTEDSVLESYFVWRTGLSVRQQVLGFTFYKLILLNTARTDA